jgi:hypothetical protein
MLTEGTYSFYTKLDTNLTLWGASELTFNHDINIYTAISGQRAVRCEMQRSLSKALYKIHLPMFIRIFLSDFKVRRFE